MVMKAFIKSLPKNGSNIYTVRIPFMEDNTGIEAVFDAIVAMSPDTYFGYAVGDCVLVSFENDKQNLAIILGKLFTEVDDDAKAYTLTNELKVTNKASLPYNTEIGGYRLIELQKLIQAIGNNSISGNGSGSTSIVAWTNNNPTESFSAQDIIFNYDLTDYTYYEVIFNTYYNVDYYQTTGKIPIGHDTRLQAGFAGSDGVGFRSRNCSYVNSTTINFSTGRYSSAGTTAAVNQDTACIPVYILLYPTGDSGSVTPGGGGEINISYSNGRITVS